MKASRWFYGIIFALLVIIISVVFISPVYFMVIMSLGDPQETFATQHPDFTIDHLYYAQPGDPDYTGTAWDKILPKWWSRVLLEAAPGGGVRLDSDLAISLFKSLRVASITAVITLVIGIPGAYAISRIEPKLKYGLMLGLFFTRMYPEVGIALPVAVRFLRLDKLLPWIDLYDSVSGIELVFAHLIITLPLSTWILVGTFDTIPWEIEEAANVDGASRLKTIFKIIIPLAAPGIAVATIFSWLASWDEVTYAIYLTLFNRTLPLEIVNIVGRSPPPVIATYATLVTIPVVFVTYFLQRWLKAGYLAGAIKG
jgi:trehalose transport system permease protein